MNTTGLVKHISKKMEMSKSKSRKTINLILAKIISEVKRGRTVKFSGFGAFYTTERKARKGRNPQNGNPVQIPAVIVPRFKPGKAFKDAARNRAAQPNEELLSEKQG